MSKRKKKRFKRGINPDDTFKGWGRCRQCGRPVKFKESDRVTVSNGITIQKGIEYEHDCKVDQKDKREQDDVWESSEERKDIEAKGGWPILWKCRGKWKVIDAWEMCWKDDHWAFIGEVVIRTPYPRKIPPYAKESK